MGAADVTVAAPERRSRKRVRSLALLALSGFVVSAVCIAALHVLRPDLDPVRRHLSEYAVGGCGALMTIAFLAAAAGSAALANVIARAISPSRALRIACGAIGIAALCQAAMAVFVTDLSVPLPGELFVRTNHGRLHDALALAHGIAWFVAVVALPLALRRDARWREFARVSWIAGLAVAATVASRAFSPPGTMGITQRLWIASIFAWGSIHAVAAWRRRDPRTVAPPGRASFPGA